MSTADGFDEKTITHTAEGANITLQEIQPVWQNGYLKNIVVTAQNTGDIDGTATVSATVEDMNFESEEFDVPSGQSVEYKYELGAGIYEDTSYAVRSGGDVQVDVTLEGPAGTDTATATKTFDGVEASLSGVELTSYAQYDSDKREVISVSFTVANRGDIPLSYDTVDITLGGSTQSYSPYSTTELKPGGSKTEFASIDGILVDSGSQELTIQFVREGEVVATATTTVTVG